MTNGILSPGQRFPDIEITVEHTGHSQRFDDVRRGRWCWLVGHGRTVGSVSTTETATFRRQVARIRELGVEVVALSPRRSEAGDPGDTHHSRLHAQEEAVTFTTADRRSLVRLGLLDGVDSAKGHSVGYLVDPSGEIVAVVATKPQIERSGEDMLRLARQAIAMSGRDAAVVERRWSESDVTESREISQKVALFDGVGIRMVTSPVSHVRALYVDRGLGLRCTECDSIRCIGGRGHEYSEFVEFVRQHEHVDVD